MITACDAWTHIKMLKQQESGFFANASLTVSDINALCDDEKTQIYLDQNSLVFLRYENGFNRLYLYAD